MPDCPVGAILFQVTDSSSPAPASQKLEETISSNRQQLSLLAISSQQSEIEMKDLVRSLTEVECLVSDLDNAAGAGEERKERLERELEELEQKITDAETELAEVEPEWRDKLKAEKDERQT